MYQKDLVSIIVPVFNLEKFIEDCLQSLLQQTYTNIEILVIDDGSTDSSCKIVSKYASQDSRIKVFRTFHKGVSAARNVGLDKAEGEYIMFVDGDDVLSVKAIEMLHSIISREKVPLVRFNFTRIEENSRKKYLDPVADDFMQKTCRSSELMKDIMQSKQGSYLWNAIYRHEEIEDIRFIEGYIFEDTPFIAEVMSRVDEYIQIDVPLYYYRRRAGSITNNRKDTEYLSHIVSESIRLDILKKHFPELYELGYSKMQTNILNAQIYIDESNSPDKKSFQEQLDAFSIKYKVTWSCVVSRYVPFVRKLLMLTAKLFGIKKASALKRRFM